MAGEIQGHQLVIELSKNNLGSIARANLDTQFTNINKTFNVPFRLAATFPTANAVLNIQPQEVLSGDGASVSAPPISSNIPTMVASTLNLQTGATTGVTFVGFTLPTSTTGYFRRMGLTALSDGTIQVLFTAEASTLAACANPGTIFVDGGIPIGWVDLVATASTAFKTSGSATAIIENYVGGLSTIHRFGSGGSGGGSGDTYELLERLKTESNSSLYKLVTPNIFAKDKATRLDGTTDAVYDVTVKGYKFNTSSQKVVSYNNLNDDFLTKELDINSVRVDAFWKLDAISTDAVYSVSRDGGTTYYPVTMSRLDSSDTYNGTLTFDGTETSTGPTALTTSATDLDGTNDISTVTTAITVAQVITTMAVALTKTGSPAGNIKLVIRRTNSTGLVVWDSNWVAVSSLSTGTKSFTCTIPLSVGTYCFQVVSDSTYKASYVNGTTELQVNANGQIRYYRPLDLRLKIVGTTTNTYLMGYGVFYNMDEVQSVAGLRGITSIPQWTPITFYRVGDVVLYNGLEAICGVQHASTSSYSTDFITSGYWTNETQNLPWVTGRVYGVNDLVIKDGYSVRCLVTHVAGTYATDLKNYYWDTPIEYSNYVTNGSFNNAIRGTTLLSAAIGKLTTLDRWTTYNYTNSGTQVKQIAGEVLGSKYGCKVNLNVAQAFVILGQPVESSKVASLRGKPVTLSFHVKKGSAFDAASGAIEISVVAGTGIDEDWTTGYTGLSFIINTNQSITTNMAKYVFTGIVPANANEMYVLFRFAGTTPNTENAITLEQVMLNEGPAPAKFSLFGGSVGAELLECKRFCQILYPSGVDAVIRDIIYNDGNNLDYAYDIPVEMRIVPTPTFVGTTSTDYMIVALGSAVQTGFTFATVSITKSQHRIRAAKNAHGLAGTGHYIAVRNSGAYKLEAEL